MKRFFESLTLLQLILLGFIAVILPLVTAIAIAVVQSQEFAASSREALVSVQSSTDRSRRLASRIRDLERSARQYLALDDEQILTLYQGHRREVRDLLAALREAAADGAIAGLLDALGVAERELTQHVETRRPGPQGDDGPPSTASVLTPEVMPGASGAPSLPTVPPSLEPVLSEPELEAVFERLRDGSTELLALYSRRGRALSNELPRQASRQRSSLVLLAVMVIPLSLLLAAVFLVLARRPLRQLDRSIRTLGGGVLTTPVEVRGARDLVELGQRLDWLRMRLMALEEQKLLFLRDVSHELKTPLTNIREASGLLLDGTETLSDGESATITRILHENGLRLQSLIEELLRFGAADDGAGGGDHEPLALHTLVEKTVQEQKLAAQARRLRLHTDLLSVTVLGNARQLEIIVSNLLSNAIKFAPERGEVHLRLARHGSEALLDVVDDGPGVPPEHRDSVFDWFFRGGTDSHAVVAGSGMGLAIASEYARLHSGSVQLLQSSGGAHFRLSLNAVGAGS